MSRARKIYTTVSIVYKNDLWRYYIYELRHIILIRVFITSLYLLFTKLFIYLSINSFEMHWRAEIPVYLGLMNNYNLSIVIV